MIISKNSKGTPEQFLNALNTQIDTLEGNVNSDTNMSKNSVNITSDSNIATDQDIISLVGEYPDLSWKYDEDGTLYVSGDTVDLFIDDAARTIPGFTHEYYDGAYGVKIVQEVGPATKGFTSTSNDVVYKGQTIHDVDGNQSNYAIYDDDGVLYDTGYESISYAIAAIDHDYNIYNKINSNTSLDNKGVAINADTEFKVGDRVKEAHANPYNYGTVIGVSEENGAVTYEVEWDYSDRGDIEYVPGDAIEPFDDAELETDVNSSTSIDAATKLDDTDDLIALISEYNLSWHYDNGGTLCVSGDEAEAFLEAASAANPNFIYEDYDGEYGVGFKDGVISSATNINAADQKVEGKTWDEFISNLEAQTKFKVDSAYRRKYDEYINLIDGPDVYEGEVTRYQDGTYELMMENIYPIEVSTDDLYGATNINAADISDGNNELISYVEQLMQESVNELANNGYTAEAELDYEYTYIQITVYTDESQFEVLYSYVQPVDEIVPNEDDLIEDSMTLAQSVMDAIAEM